MYEWVGWGRGPGAGERSERRRTGARGELTRAAVELLVSTLARAMLHQAMGSVPPIGGSSENRIPSRNCRGDSC